MKTTRIAAGVAAAAAASLVALPATASAAPFPYPVDVHANNDALTATTANNGDVEVTVTAQSDAMCAGPFLVNGKYSAQQVEHALVSGNGLPGATGGSADQAAAVLGSGLSGIPGFANGLPIGGSGLTTAESPYTATFSDLSGTQAYTAISGCFALDDITVPSGTITHSDFYVRTINGDAATGSLASLDVFGSLGSLSGIGS